MESERPKWEQKKKKKLIWPYAVILLIISAVFTLHPQGFASAWRQVFSAAGLSDISAQADGIPLAVHVLDVGKADAIVAECQGRFLLIDGGTPDRGEQVARYLKRRGAEKLDYMISTHPDSDHSGGLETVLSELDADAFLSPQLPAELEPTDSQWRSLMDTLAEKQLVPQHPQPGTVLPFGGGTLEILGPVKAGGDVNDCSLIVRITYGETKLLFMGDAGIQEEKDLLESGVDLSAEVIKVGHHGSATSTTRLLLNAVKPRFAAVSVGKDSSGLPKKEALDRLKKAGAAIYRTDLDGTLLFLSDGKEITVKTER